MQGRGGGGPCHSQQEIAETVGVPQNTLVRWIESFIQISDADKWINFDPPLYNVWKQQVKTEGYHKTQRFVLW